MDVKESLSFLVVDDNVPLSDIIVRVIHRVAPQADVTQVDHVAEALTALQTTPFTALIVDYRLPDGEGVEIIRWARDHDMDLPIIAMSGLNVDNEMQAVGADHVLGKPFHIDRLMTILHAIVNPT